MPRTRKQQHNPEYKVKSHYKPVIFNKGRRKFKCWWNARKVGTNLKYKRPQTHLLRDKIKSLSTRPTANIN